jgi:hypothetical protein
MQGDCWVSLTLPEGGASITLTTAHENLKPGTMTLYLATSGVVATHKELGAKGAKVNAPMTTCSVRGQA